LNVHLKRLNKDNWEDCAQLTVEESQQKFVASNIYSIAEVQFLENFEAYAVYDSDQMVGFTMFGLDEDDYNYWIYRLMVDKRFQGKGYGKAALQQTIHYLRQKPDCENIMVGYHPENIVVANLYKRFGFKEKGIAPSGEMVACLKMK